MKHRPATTPAASRTTARAGRSARGPRARSLDSRLYGALLLLILATVAVYAPVLHHGFVEWDDPYYVTENSHVRAGLSAGGIAWAFTAVTLANWHPLTWLSHMLDVSLFGLSPSGHHLTSLLLHLANTLLLFDVIRRMTGSPWRSLGVAALFALHPLHVESVAWISERKDVLSTFFWLAAIWAHARHVERPAPTRYALVALAFGLGLMAKPMLVSLPLTLLILDGWPLSRARDMRLSTWRPLVVEKLPLFAMSLASAVVAWLAQKSGGAMAGSPLSTRVANVILGYAGYLEKTVWPAGLSALYPYREHPPAAEVAAKAAVLVVVTAAVAWFGRRRAYLVAGWLWYLVTLMPVIGLVRIGQQGMADRYSYVPLVGVFVMLVWGAADLAARMRLARGARTVTGGAAVLAAAALALGARHQVGTWKDGTTLWERVIAVGGNSAVIQNNLGAALEKAGRLDEAASHFVEATRLDPRHSRARCNLGNVRFEQGRLAEAIQAYDEALRIDPDYGQARLNLAKAHYNLANSVWRGGHPDQAEREYREAIRARPDDAGFHRGLGLVLAQQRRYDEAADAFRVSIQLDPGNAAAHDGLAMAFFYRGEYPGAWREVQACRRLGGTPTPSLVEALTRRIPEPR